MYLILLLYTQIVGPILVPILDYFSFHYLGLAFVLSAAVSYIVVGALHLRT